MRQRFDEVIDRRGTSSLKWEFIQQVWSNAIVTARLKCIPLGGFFQKRSLSPFDFG
jgi:hypothetical protein